MQSVIKYGVDSGVGGIHSETIVFGGGCFWCTEAVFTMLTGVVSAEPGYAGGDAATANYEQVSRGDTGHIEVVKIVYDPDRLALEELLGVFFATHDPMQMNRQGDDVGPQYASVIFYTTDRQREKAEHYLSVLREKAGVPAVTRVAPLRAFYPAEDYHKNYFAAHKDAPYCQLVIAPKVEKVAQKFKGLIK